MAQSTSPSSSSEPQPLKEGTAAAATDTGTFTLLLFASASSYADTESLSLTAPTTLGAVFRTLEQKFPGMTQKILQSSAVTVNLEYVDVAFPEGVEADDETQAWEGWDIHINPGDEVGIIPPVSSG